jgi:anti-sigma factor RsiW
MPMLRQSPVSNQEHLALTHFDAYQDGMLTEEEQAAIRQHLDGCDECRARVESQMKITRQLVSEASPEATLPPHEESFDHE